MFFWHDSNMYRESFFNGSHFACTSSSDGHPMSRDSSYDGSDWQFPPWSPFESAAGSPRSLPEPDGEDSPRVATVAQGVFNINLNLTVNNQSSSSSTGPAPTVSPTATNTPTSEPAPARAPATASGPGTRHSYPARAVPGTPEIRYYAVWRLGESRALAGVHYGEHPLPWQALSAHFGPGGYSPQVAALRRETSREAAEATYRTGAARNQAPPVPQVYIYHRETAPAP